MAGHSSGSVPNMIHDGSAGGRVTRFVTRFFTNYPKNGDKNLVTLPGGAYQNQMYRHGGSTTTMTNSSAHKNKRLSFKLHFDHDDDEDMGELTFGVLEP